MAGDAQSIASYERLISVGHYPRDNWVVDLKVGLTVQVITNECNTNNLVVEDWFKCS